VYFNLGEAYFSKGDVDKASKHYAEFLKCRPDYVEALNNLGIAYETKGMAGKAAQKYQKVLNIKPDHEGAQKRLSGQDSADTFRIYEFFAFIVHVKPGLSVAYLLLLS
jgi:tetratricopeptide (TPR) repeat protein